MDRQTITQKSWQEVITPERFSGLKVAITGAGSGIGLATALRCAREGADVIAIDRDADRVSALMALYPNLSITGVVADITTSSGIDAIVAAVGSRLDGLVNNAGIIDGFAPLGEIDDALWDKVMAVNVDAPFRLTRALLPLLLQSEAASVVNVASIAAERGSSCGTAYTTSKHALVGMTRSAAFFYGPKGVRFNVVAPGGVDTNIVGAIQSEWGFERVMDIATASKVTSAQADQLAASITFLLSRDGTNIHGALLASDGGWSAI